MLWPQEKNSIHTWNLWIYKSGCEGSLTRASSRQINHTSHINSDTSWYNTKWGAREQPPKHKKRAPVETSEPSKWGAHRNQLEPNFKKRRSSWSQSFNKSWKGFSFLEIKRFEVNYVTFDNIKCTTSHNNIIWVMYYRILNGNINNVLYSHKP